MRAKFEYLMKMGAEAFAGLGLFGPSNGGNGRIKGIPARHNVRILASLIPFTAMIECS